MKNISEKPLISIIILNWNGYEVTRDCLYSLRGIAYKNYNVILVDNGSKDGSVQKLKEEFIENLNIEFIALEKNRGFTGGNNVGFDYAIRNFNPDYYLMLNNDTVVEPDFIDEMLLPFADSRVYAVVPKIYFFEPKNTLWFAGGSISSLTGIAKQYGLDQVDKGQFDIPKEISYMNGCCALISAECVISLGVLDDIYFANTEDVDYSIRIAKSGHSIFYHPKAVIYHKANYSFKSNKGQWFAFYLSTRNKIILHQKHAGLLDNLIFMFAFGFRWVLYLSIKLSLKRDFKAVKAIYWGIEDGLRSRLRFVS